MTTESVGVGEREKLGGGVDSGQLWYVEVADAPVRVATRRNRADDGASMNAGDVAYVGVPQGSELWAYGAGDIGAVVSLDAVEGTFPGQDSGTSLYLELLTRTDVSGTVNLADRDGADIDGDNPLDVTQPNVNDLIFGRETIDVSDTPQPMVAFSEEIIGGYSLAIKALSGNASAVEIGDAALAVGDGFPLDPGEGISLGVDNLDAVEMAGESGDGVAFIVENREGGV